MADPLRVANCSGFYGDRLAAAREMVSGGPIDVLTGDWLAELTMLILARNQLRDPQAGYARTFVTQMEQVMGTCLDRGIKVVSNAGGLSPRGCADAVGAVADRLGLHPKISYVEGDNLVSRVPELAAAGVTFPNMDTGEELSGRPVLTANAYVGGWGIAEALGRGADIVITGRCTDAALTVGPAAHHHGWARDDWDRLAGAVVAGHVIECGPQATGGNFAFFRAIPGLDHPGFPIAEVAADGSAVITKHAGQGGAVTIGTVTAQLLYEIGSPRYDNPDVSARFDTIVLDEDGPDRVRIHGVKGEPPPETTKVCINLAGGYKTILSFPLVGLDIDEKASLVERALWAAVDRASFSSTEVTLVRTEQDDPPLAELRICIKDPSEEKLGRALSAAVTELALSNYPGFHLGSSATQSYGVYWPALMPSSLVWQEVVVDGERTVVESTPSGPRSELLAPSEVVGPTDVAGPTTRAPLGRVAGARSGDKGGNANVGVWVADDEAYGWLASFLTVERFKALVPDAARLTVHRYELPNIRAVNFVVVGLLGEGVASSSRPDPQAKSLGEFLRGRLVDIPTALCP